MLKLYENIKKFRKERQWTQEDLAKRTGYERSMIAKIESGNVDLTQSKIDVFASAFGVTASELVEYEENSTGIEMNVVSRLLNRYPSIFTDPFIETYAKMSVELKKQIRDYADFLLKRG